MPYPPVTKTFPFCNTDENFMLSPNKQKEVHDNGRHTAFGKQQVIIHTDTFDEHAYVMLLHGSKIEHSIPGAQ
ncbi:unnamed protein product [Rotaria sp. Silwood1]|nr:unnamed protein product [Rotaria sp. Silwood1]CAF1182875.1 unnamed protein product [Rotaria sp. Silwood1]CAF3457562.1 unnamed protein product [Rotaria sp. Silwood1]CAF4529701.1 unnamed protein product [Rotaria sp. Silwood1]CAF4760339.1 unnamed protein product [Rotaria sp. Silwood1]